MLSSALLKRMIARDDDTSLLSDYLQQGVFLKKEVMYMRLTFFKKVKDFVKGCIIDFNRALQESKSISEFNEKSEEIIYSQLERMFGTKTKQILIIGFSVVSLIIGGTKLVADDFRLLKNIEYAITTDTVIENELKKKDEKISSLREENARLRGAYEQLKEDHQYLQDLLQDLYKKQQK